MVLRRSLELQINIPGLFQVQVQQPCANDTAFEYVRTQHGTALWLRIRTYSARERLTEHNNEVAYVRNKQ